MTIASCATPRAAGERVREELAARSSSRGITLLAGDETFVALRTDEGRPLRIMDMRAHGDVQVLRPDITDPDLTDALVSRDHPYQRGLRLAHADVDGHDLWTDDSSIALESSTVRMQPDGSARVDARLAWNAPDGTLLCSETRAMTFTSFEGLRLVDIATNLAATGERVTFGDAKDGLFALRLADGIAGRAPGIQVFDSEGREGTAIWGKPARWVAHAGEMRTPDGLTRPVTVAVLDHPDNPRSPCRWQVRPYGIVAANPFGRSAFDDDIRRPGTYRLPAYSALDLRYRVAIADRILSSPEVDELWNEFAGRADQPTD